MPERPTQGVLSLPMWPGFTEREVDYIAAAVREVIDQRDASAAE